MCGIAAIIHPRDEVEDGIIEKMTVELSHRGPDARGWVRTAGCHLGHTRLSIIDLVGGNQPMADPSGRFSIVFNGEIYNYRELRAELEERGRAFRTQSDTEVLLLTYLEFGERALEKLNGQFAFLIWDAADRRLFGARDRFGEKPLFVAEGVAGHFLAASEIKGILASGLVEPRLDPVSVDAYLALWYVPPDRTIYRNIFPLRPGHALVWEGGKWRQRPYWQPSISGREPGDLTEVVGEVRRLVSRAVERQMVADVPLGAFLSGGLDSSTIVALMAKRSDRPILTFSVGFGDLINELPYARLVSQAYQTRHHEIQMDIHVEEMLERMAEVYDEPFGDSSNIPTYLMSRFARQHVKVVLAGDGADEIFGGYDWYSPLLRDEQIPSGRLTTARLHLEAIGWTLAKRAGLPVEERQGRVKQEWHEAELKRRHPDFWERHLARASTLKVDRSFLWGGRQPEETEEVLRRGHRGEWGRGLDQAVAFDLSCYLPGDILVKVDRAAMAHGLETRAPFLDRELAEFVLSLPQELRFKNQTQKFLLRESCGHLWPSPLRTRRKQGFGAPIGDWLQRPGVARRLEQVCSRSHPLGELLPGVTRMPRYPHPQLRWTVLCLGLWLEKRTACLKGLS